MGHDHHFLSRLDRVNSEQVELALGLYRDSELVKTILSKTKLPEGESRIAISMDDPREGPFILVERSGRFVTCLARGMQPYGLRVITRAELDKIATKVVSLRDALKRARAATPTDSERRRLMNRIGRTGPGMPRDDFATLLLWSPMMWHQFLLGYLQAYEENSTERLELITGDGHKEPDSVLENHYKRVHGMGHLIVLAASDSDPDAWQDMGPLLNTGNFTLTHGTTSQHSIPLALRGAWAAACIGEPLVESYKKALENELALYPYDSILCLAAIGMRHEKLRGRVREILEAAASRWKAAGEDSKFESDSVDHAVALLDGPNDESRKALGVGRLFVHATSQFLPEDNPYRYASEDAVPDDLAVTGIANLPLDWSESRNSYLTLSLLPYIAVSKAENLYLPRPLVRVMCPPWERSTTIDFLKRHGMGSLGGEPVRAPKKVGRNEPCPCGSGKKYKKCHGA